MRTTARQRLSCALLLTSAAACTLPMWLLATDRHPGFYWVQAAGMVTLLWLAWRVWRARLAGAAGQATRGLFWPLAGVAVGCALLGWWPAAPPALVGLVLVQLGEPDEPAEPSEAGES